MDADQGIVRPRRGGFRNVDEPEIPGLIERDSFHGNKGR
jgi:hypothetical protein